MLVRYVYSIWCYLWLAANPASDVFQRSLWIFYNPMLLFFLSTVWLFLLSFSSSVLYISLSLLLSSFSWCLSRSVYILTLFLSFLMYIHTFRPAMAQSVLLLWDVWPQAHNEDLQGIQQKAILQHVSQSGGTVEFIQHTCVCVGVGKKGSREMDAIKWGLVLRVCLRSVRFRCYLQGFCLCVFQTNLSYYHPFFGLVIPNWNQFWSSAQLVWLAIHSFCFSVFHNGTDEDCWLGIG